MAQIIQSQSTRIVDRKIAKRVRNYQILVVLLTTLPSLYLAVRLVQQEVFMSKASAFVAKEFSGRQVHATQVDIDAKRRKNEVTLIGEILSPPDVARIGGRLSDFGLEGAKLRDRKGIDDPWTARSANRSPAARCRPAATSPFSGKA